MKYFILTLTFFISTQTFADSRFHGTPVFAASAKEIAAHGDSFESNTLIRERASNYCNRMYGVHSQALTATVGYVSEPRIIDLSILGEEHDRIVSRRLRGAVEFDEIKCGEK